MLATTRVPFGPGEVSDDQLVTVQEKVCIGKG